VELLEAREELGEAATRNSRSVASVATADHYGGRCGQSPSRDAASGDGGEPGGGGSGRRSRSDDGFAVALANATTNAGSHGGSPSQKARSSRGAGGGSASVLSSLGASVDKSLERLRQAVRSPLSGGGHFSGGDGNSGCGGSGGLQRHGLGAARAPGLNLEAEAALAASGLGGSSGAGAAQGGGQGVSPHGNLGLAFTFGGGGGGGGAPGGSNSLSSVGGGAAADALRHAKEQCDELGALVQSREKAVEDLKRCNTVTATRDWIRTPCSSRSASTFLLPPLR
jgi:hypothetical protein